jgi:hypothetical protein
MTDDDREFLQTLDKKLHYTAESSNLTLRPDYKPYKWDLYHHDMRMTGDELERVIGLMNDESYAIMPIVTDMTIGHGFSVIWIDPYGCERPRSVLKFLERQMPNSTTWEQMAECYMGEMNLELLDMIGAEKPDPKMSSYNY